MRIKVCFALVCFKRKTIKLENLKRNDILIVSLGSVILVILFSFSGQTILDVTRKK